MATAKRIAGLSCSVDGGVLDDADPAALGGDHRGAVGPVEQEGLLADARAGLVERQQILAVAPHDQPALEEHVEVVGRLPRDDQRVADLEHRSGRPAVRSSSCSIRW